MQVLFAGLVFFIVVLVFGGIILLARGRKDSDIIRGRLEAIEKGTSYSKSSLDLNLIRDELLSSIPAVNRVLVRWSWPSRLRNFIAQAGMQVRPGKLVLIGAVAGLSVAEVVQNIYHNVGLSAAAGALVALIPFIYIGVKRARRMSSFQRQFPEVIELLSRSVRAGHSFTAGLEIVASDLPDPVSSEFRMSFDEQRFGLPLRDALLGLCDRVPLVDVRLFVIALLVQKETGGNLAEILDNLTHVIRERFRIAGEVGVRTAQGRLTAGILIALPVVMMMLLRVMDPDYINVLFVDRLGQIMLISAAVMQAIGALVVWKIVQIKV